MRLQNKELHDLYLSSDIIRVVIKSRGVRWAGHTARMWEKRGACRDLVGKSEEERQLGRRRRRLGDNIKIVFKKWYWDCGQD
jgi:hypothetical protein